MKTTLNDEKKICTMGAIYKVESGRCVFVRKGMGEKKREERRKSQMKIG